VRRILHVTYSNYLDDSNGASVASRAMLEYLASRGFAVRVVCGPGLEAGSGEDVAGWAASRGLAFVPGAEGPAHLFLDLRGVAVAVLRGPTTPRDPGADECQDFLALFEAAWERHRPEVVVGYGGGALSREVLRRAKARGAATVFPLHNLRYRDAAPFADADAVVVASRFAAEHYRATLGLRCTVLPNLVDPGRVRAEVREPRYIVFVNPTVEKGVFLFARVADEVGRRRPDIPFLVVESRGTESDVASCGLDLQARGNVFFLPETPDPRRFWRVARLCLLPSLVAENQPMVAIEAMTNGVPVLGTDRGGIPETLGRAGVVFSPPGRLTPATRVLPTVEEVAPWVESILRLWDHPELIRRAPPPGPGRGAAVGPGDPGPSAGTVLSGPQARAKALIGGQSLEAGAISLESRGGPGHDGPSTLTGGPSSTAEQGTHQQLVAPGGNLRTRSG